MSENLSLSAQEARRDYKRRYRARNREKINEQQRAWRAGNKDKVREYQRRYWERKAERRNIRASWEDYGLDKRRREELLEIVKSGKYAKIALDAAMRADEKAARHILLSATKDLPYEKIEYVEGLGRCPAGRTDFYGLKRLFFHCLDEMLKSGAEKED